MQHQIVSQVEWLSARKALLEREKELTRALDALNAERQALPWVKIDKNYLFDGPDGKVTLADLFEGRSQLIVNHFMFAPDWTEGCVGCSFGADHLDGALQHILHHDVSFVAVSRAPYAKIDAFRKRMGWRFRWVSSETSDFNYDFHVSFRPDEVASGNVFYNFEMGGPQGEEAPGKSVFFKDENGQVFHTYSVFGRGDETTLGAYMLLDMTPKGRNENGPHRNLMDWVKHHDKYEDGGGNCCCG